MDYEVEHIHQLCREVLAELDADEIFHPQSNITGRTQVRLLVAAAANSVVEQVAQKGIVNKRELGLELLFEGLLCLAADKQNKIDSN